MKIYLCSDIHNRFHKFIPQEPVDLILCAGDITNFGADGNFTTGFAFAREWLDRLSTKAQVLYIPGNHDIGLKEYPLKPYQSLLPQHENILHKEMSFNGVSLYGASLSVCYKAPDLATTWENMTCNPMLEEVYYSDIPYCDILLSHSPPSGVIGTCKENGELGSTALRAWIEKNQPRLVVCGHIHDPVAREEVIGRTRIINVATRSQIIDFDPEDFVNEAHTN